MTQSRSARRILAVSLSALVFVMPASPLDGQSQGTTTISGRVISDQGQVLGGANVRITELGVSVGTNDAGRYVITLPPDSTRRLTLILHARAIGFKPDQRPIMLGSGDQNVDFTLATDVNRLEEVVIAGVTGATTQHNLPFTVVKVS